MRLFNIEFLTHKQAKESREREERYRKMVQGLLRAVKHKFVIERGIAFYKVIARVYLNDNSVDFSLKEFPYNNLDDTPKAKAEAMAYCEDLQMGDFKL